MNCASFMGSSARITTVAMIYPSAEVNVIATTNIALMLT
jgi:hypothetical protein